MDPVEQRRIAQAGKEVDPGWYRVHRRVSIHLTRAALALGLSANHASLGMMAAGLAGAALLVPASLAANAVGFAVLYLAFLLDKVDGELARLQGTQNAQGIFLDRMHHRLVEPCLFLAVALHEHLRTGSLVPLVAGFATVVLANAIEENQHLAPYILFKRVREGDRVPGGDAPPARSPGWGRAAALLRPLKGFRMFIVALPLFALAYAAQAMGGRAVPTFVLAASAIALAVYLVFQILHYLREQLDAETHVIGTVVRRSLAEGEAPMDRPTLRFGVLLLLASTGAAGLAAVTPPAARAAGTFYVDGANPSCSNAGPGSPAVPYCTIGAALTAQAGPGTTIRVAGGTYREQVTVPQSGTAGNPLVIEGTGTFANPTIIEGGEWLDDPALWVPATGTTFLAPSVTWATLMVIVDGQRLVPWAGAPDSIPVGGFRHVPGSGLYANLGAGGEAGNPGGRQTIVGRLTHGVFVNNRAWVTVRNLHIRHANDRGVQVTNSSDVGVADNVIEWVQRFGIQAQNSTRVNIARNRTRRNGDHGITLTAGSNACVVEHNETAYNARPGQRAANGIHLFDAPRNVVRRNDIHHNQDTGLHVQAGSDTTLSLQNVCWQNGDHGFDHLSVLGSIHLGDVSYGNHMDGFSFEGGTQNQRMHDCISVANGTTTGRYDLYVDSTSAIGHVSNDNLFWNPDGSEPVKYDKIVYATVAAYSAATGQDTRTIQADPRFLSPAEGNFHLASNSPAIDAANTALAEWPGVDADGYGPVDHPGTANTGIGPVTFADRGAYEYGSAGIVGVPDPAPAVIVEGVSPNPLGGGEGRLAFTTSRPGPLAVDLYDARGRHVRSLLSSDAAPAGAHVAPVDARDASGTRLPAGIYLYRVRSADGERGGKFVLLR
jgi:phosphatidylglycerophosphate synthase